MEGYTMTKMIVWIGKSKYWNRVYLKDGQLYIRLVSAKYAPLNNYPVTRVDTL